jgi:peptidyl-tRNA hydrolase, PTH1 family
VRLPGRRPTASSSLDWLVAGLGNPGPRYRATRHNAGFMVADRLADRLAGSWRDRFHGRLCEARDGDARVALLEPQTMMNDSGRSVAAAARFYKLTPERVLVVHDEIDIPLGDVRAKLGGGLAGHNGLRSVAQHLGTQEFARVRVGVGRPERGDPRPVVDWVLTPFEAHVDVDGLVERATDCAQLVLREGIDAAMLEYR